MIGKTVELRLVIFRARSSFTFHRFTTSYWRISPVLGARIDGLHICIYTVYIYLNKYRHIPTYTYMHTHMYIYIYIYMYANKNVSIQVAEVGYDVTSDISSILNGGGRNVGGRCELVST